MARQQRPREARPFRNPDGRPAADSGGARDHRGSGREAADGRQLATTVARQSFVSATTITSRALRATSEDLPGSERESACVPDPVFSDRDGPSSSRLCCILGIPARSFQNNCTNSAFADSSGSAPLLLCLFSFSLALSLPLSRRALFCKLIS